MLDRTSSELSIAFKNYRPIRSYGPSNLPSLIFLLSPDRLFFSTLYILLSLFTP